MSNQLDEADIYNTENKSNFGIMYGVNVVGKTINSWTILIDRDDMPSVMNSAWPSQYMDGCSSCKVSKSNDASHSCEMQGAICHENIVENWDGQNLGYYIKRNSSLAIWLLNNYPDFLVPFYLGYCGMGGWKSKAHATQWRYNFVGWRYK